MADMGTKCPMCSVRWTGAGIGEAFGVREDNQSELTPERRTSSAQRGISAARKAANTSGVLPTGSLPCWANFSRSSGERSAVGQI